MFLVRLERRSTTGIWVSMWLRSLVPAIWGEREFALKFVTEAEAQRAAEAINLRGAWYVESEQAESLASAGPPPRS